MEPDLGDWMPPGEAKFPAREAIHGKHATLIPLEPSHARAVYKEVGGPANTSTWAYVSLDGFDKDRESFEAAFSQMIALENSLLYGVLSSAAYDASSNASPEILGVMGFVNISVANRAIEVGVILGRKMRQTPLSTEAHYLLMRYAFEDLGFMRYEWRTSDRNKASLTASERLGFHYDGTLRKNLIVKGRRRDTAVLSILDEEWPAVGHGFRTWLNPENFDEDGKQKLGLKECRDSFKPDDGNV